MENLGHVMHDGTVIVYAIRRLARIQYIYVGSTTQPIEVRLRRHLMDARKKRHVNKRLAHIIRQSQYMLITDVLEVCPIHQRAEVEYSHIMRLHEEGHKLTNQTNPKNPRQKLSFAK